MGTCVTDPLRRHPAVTAQLAITLDLISNGRAILGIGAGEAFHLNPYGIAWERPISRLEEAVRVIKKLWSEDFADYNGVFFKLKRAVVIKKSVQKPYPPIWIGAMRPRALRVVGVLGDG